MTNSVDVHKIFAEYFKGCEALAYALSSKLGEGNICIDIDRYKEDLPRLIEEKRAKESFKEEDTIFWPDPADFEKQCREGEFVAHSDELKPFIVLGKSAYLHRYFTYETQIIESIKRLGDKFHIITGGPGTGKTYSVSTKLVEMFSKNINLKVALAAPTGKAAMRMNEAIKDFAKDPNNDIEPYIKGKLTGLTAQTIHRLLVYIPDSVFFKYNDKNQMPYDLVIIDECSMIDGPLMAKLLQAVGDSTNLILMGDKDQLAAVEAGSVFGDLCKSEKTKCLTGKVEFKTESWRFEKDKGIGKFSQEVISGHINDIGSYDNDDQLKIDDIYSGSLFEQYAILYKEYIDKTEIEDALKLLNKIRFLCVTRESAAEVNKKIEYFLYRNVDGFKPRTGGFYHNQPVIVTQNDYKLGLFNGDVGIIRKEIINGTESFYANFENSEGGIKKIPAGFLNNFETVFAMTVHKSQGSEFDHVVVIFPLKNGEKLLTRELLYTAVTRAKVKKGSKSAESDHPAIKVLIQAKTEDIESCVKKVVSRASGIENRLNNL